MLLSHFIVRRFSRLSITPWRKKTFVFPIAMAVFCSDNREQSFRASFLAAPGTVVFGENIDTLNSLNVGVNVRSNYRKQRQ